MNLKNLSIVVSLICLQIYSPQGHSEIKNKDVLLKFFEGCVSEDYGSADGFHYCGCAASRISKTMTLEGLLSLALKIEDLSERSQAKTVLANNKLKKVMIECAPYLLED